jgi:hypothetical protein
LPEEEPAMSERALAFVEEWVSDHVSGADGAPADASSQAKALARQCLADASAQGIPQGEIGESIDDLEEFMAGALEEAHERKAHRSGEEGHEGEHEEEEEEGEGDDEGEDDEDDDEDDDDDDDENDEEDEN